MRFVNAAAHTGASARVGASREATRGSRRSGERRSQRCWRACDSWPPVQDIPAPVAAPVPCSQSGWSLLTGNSGGVGGGGRERGPKIPLAPAGEAASIAKVVQRRPDIVARPVAIGVVGEDRGPVVI